MSPYHIGMDEKRIADVTFNFGVDFKSAAGDKLAVELADGDLLIEGWGANYEIDREDEAFEEGAFSKAIDKFLSGNAPLCYHHKYDTVIGKVVSAEQVPGKGVRLRAVVDKQPENSPYRHIYEGIKKGRINGLSCGGIFKRRMTADGPKIYDVDLLEWSTTPVSVGRGTNFSVVAGKAVAAPEEAPEAVVEEQPETPEVETPELEQPETPEAETPETPEAEAPETPEEETEEKPSLFVTNENIEDAAVTSDKIAPGSIEAEHFSDDLRSRFSELKPDEQEIELEALMSSLGTLGERLEQVADRIGFKFPEPENKHDDPTV